VVKIDTKGLTPMAAGRLRKALDAVYEFNDGTRTLREWLAQQAFVEKSEGDGIADWNRRYYYLNGVRVPKVVYDVVEA